MRRRGWFGALCGVALGSALPWPWAAQPASPREPTSELTPAAGRSDAREAPSSPQLPLRTARDRHEPRAPKESARLTPQAIAQRALQVSMFVRVGSTYGAGIALGRGHVLTCGHVLDDSNPSAPILVEGADGAAYQATLIERDRELDLALLSTTDTARQRPAFGATSSLTLGDEVFAMGAPKRMAFSLHRGMVSFVDREFDGIRYLQTDLPTNGGNSGGPVFNDRGEIVAISAFILRDSQGIAFALPIDDALRRFDTFLSDRKAANPN